MSDPLLLRVQHPELGPRYVLQDGEVVADVSEPVGTLADWLAGSVGRAGSGHRGSCASRPLQRRRAGRASEFDAAAAGATG